MTTTYILALKDSQANLATVGGKGASLARLAQAGLPVPEGFHITTAAYQRFIVENELLPPIFAAVQRVDTAHPVTAESAASEIHLLFARAVMPSSIADDIRSAYNTLCHHLPTIGPLPVAVRSSATAEDLPDLAFAGQHETYLNVRGEEALLDAVKKCWASLWTARAISYRAQNQIDHQTVSLAVMVQRLVPAEAAGILFTANPISGQRNQGMLTATWGLGEAIVGGLVTPDTILIDKSTGRVVKRETADKQIMTVLVESGTQEQATPEQLRRAPVLTDAQAAELMRNGGQIEELYERPMDIEWTLAEGKLAIVQARPITALPESPLEWPLPDPKAVLARGSLAEFVPEPVSPLFATLAVPIARETTTQLMQEMGVTKKDAYLLTVINHYVYIGIKFTPSLVWQFAIATFRLTKMLLTTAAARAMQQHEQYLAVTQKWQARDITTLTPTEILIGVREIFRATAEYYNVAQSGTIPTSMMSELTFAAFYDRLIKRKADPEAATFVFGSDNQAVRAEKALFDLALWVKEHPALANAVRQASTPDVCLALTVPHTHAHWVEFCARFAAHLAQYGHAIYDLDFSKPVPAEEPTPLVEALKVFLSGGSNPYERQRVALDHRDRAANAIAQRLDPLRRKYFWQLLKWAQDTAHLREDSIADLGLGYPQLRKMLGELGHRLANNGAIAQTQDVYWLEAQEADASAIALERGEPLNSYSQAVATRQAKWQAMRRITPPTTLPRKTWMATFYPNEGQKGNTIKGFGASAGKVTAPACIILGPEDFGKLRPGDVIVAGITTPAWTPLFARAAAIVTDIGGPLSHSSIVAREYGIPAVLATGNGTRRIRDGQVITVDGEASVVRLEGGQLTGETKTPTDWKLPQGAYAALRNNIVELMIDPLSPLFATLGLSAINTSLHRLLNDSFAMHGIMPENIIIAVNGYAYNNGSVSAAGMARMLFGAGKIMRMMFTGAVERWTEVGRLRYRQIVAEWQAKNWRAYPAVELVNSVKQLTEAAMDAYGALISGVIPAAWITEALFTRLYTSLIQRRDDPTAPTYLLGYESLPIRADQSLYSLAEWAQGQAALKDCLNGTPTTQLVALCAGYSAPSEVPSAVWQAWRERFQKHLSQFGHTLYDLDFAHPVPADNASPVLDAFKLYLRGGGANPYTRQRESATHREQAAAAIQQRLTDWRLRWFNQHLASAQKYAPLREDGLAEIGLAYPLIRQMLRELGRRFTERGIIHTPDDIFWLTETEVTLAATRLDAEEAVPVLSDVVPMRQAEYQTTLHVTPPMALPQMKIFGVDLMSLRDRRGRSGQKNLIKGVATSPGTVTATARVLHSPEDFNQMQPGEVLVASITTPAWTPLFAMASAVVTDIGGPLSHGSIVAREYGIPAVLGTGVATKCIHSGQTITVDGGAGTVTLSSNGP